MHKLRHPFVCIFYTPRCTEELAPSVGTSSKVAMVFFTKELMSLETRFLLARQVLIVCPNMSNQSFYIQFQTFYRCPQTKMTTHPTRIGSLHADDYLPCPFSRLQWWCRRWVLSLLVESGEGRRMQFLQIQQYCAQVSNIFHIHLESMCNCEGYEVRCLMLEEAREQLLQLGSGGCLAVVEDPLFAFSIDRKPSKRF